MEPGIPSQIPSIRPIRINRTTKNATAAHTCAPSPKQSTRDWIRIPGESVGLGPSVTPLGLLSAPRMSARGAIWAHIQIITACSCPTMSPLPLTGSEPNFSPSRFTLCTLAVARCASSLLARGWKGGQLFAQVHQFKSISSLKEVLVY